MNRIGPSLVVGMVILLIGASIAVDLVFDVHLPLFRIAIAALFVVWGSRMVVNALARRDRVPEHGEVWLADRRFTPTGELGRNSHYDVVFGRGVVDLTHLARPTEDVTVTVDTLFGAAIIKVDPSIAYDAHGKSMFGEIRMPDHTSTAMGTVDYAVPGSERPWLHLRVNTMFGACQIVETSG